MVNSQSLFINFEKSQGAQNSASLNRYNCFSKSQFLFNLLSGTPKDFRKVERTSIKPIKVATTRTKKCFQRIFVYQDLQKWQKIIWEYKLSHPSGDSAPILRTCRTLQENIITFPFLRYIFFQDNSRRIVWHFWSNAE